MRTNRGGESTATGPNDFFNGLLNVLIGPNGSGKSNLIEALNVLRASATKLAAPVRGKGGGVTEWIWKGEGNDQASIEVVIGHPKLNDSLRHAITFTENQSSFELVNEWITLAGDCVGTGRSSPPIYSTMRSLGGAILGTRSGTGSTRKLLQSDTDRDESILSQIKDPDQYPELSCLADTYEGIRIYREWNFGRSSVFRLPQAADLPNDRLEEDFSNLGLFLNHLRRIPKAKKRILEHLGDLYEGLNDFDVHVRGGSVDVFLTEGDFTIPAGRLSDGTLRYLCLLAILCDPDPPPVICIEEPELGLHPDLLPKIADLLMQASEQCQIIVTTHSDILVDAMSEQPESVVVFEKVHGETQARRLTASEELKKWLEKYRLGELWTQGQIGGTRW